MTLKLTNTLSRKKEEFIPLKKNKVGLYACGPTVYNYAHVGNLRSYIFEDVLKRTLLLNGYKVKHVMNITDVGHLTSDADEGEDKVEQEAKKEGKTAHEIAEFYTKAFFEDLKKLHIVEPDITPRATATIREQIAFVKTLEKKDFTYKTSDGIYFDTSKLTDYGKLVRLGEQKLRHGMRIDLGEKKNPTDFALWKFSKNLGTRQMEWESPWGIGFPGWHLECSVMSMMHLGDTFDLHCGGIDHMPVHHTNEIAQSEALTGKPFVNYWLHGEFLVIDEKRMGKSEGNFLTLAELEKKDFSPLAYRYFVLGAHYRTKLNFTFEALEGAQHAIDKLYRYAQDLGKPAVGCAEYEEKFLAAVNDDLDTPKGLALLWELLKSDYPDSAKQASILYMDKVLGLGLADIQPIRIPKEIQKLVAQREEARKEKDWKASDTLRDEIAKLGFTVEDMPDGTTKITKHKTRGT